MTWRGTEGELYRRAGSVLGGWLGTRGWLRGAASAQRLVPGGWLGCGLKGPVLDPGAIRNSGCRRARENFPGISDFYCPSILEQKHRILVFEKAEEPEIKLPTSIGSWKKQESSRKTSTSALLTMPKPLTVWLTTNWKIYKWNPM